MATPNALGISTTTTTPDITQTIDQIWFIEPIGGPKHPINYLERFPEEVYNKSIDSRLVKLMYALLGPAGVGWLRKNYLQARLELEEHGLGGFDLDQFYGNPLKFGRIVEEIYEDDPDGVLPRAAWDAIRAKDARYRSRAIDFLNGARMGNTPEGIHLVARSGLGHEVEIVENYRHLYDIHSDDPLGLPNYGKTNAVEEFVVLPRQEVSRSEIQTVAISGSPTGGTFRLFFPVGNEATNTTSSLAWNINRFDLKIALAALPTIGAGNIVVSGGPLPGTPIDIQFTGKLGARDVPQLVPSSSLTGGTLPLVLVTTDVGGADATLDIVDVAPIDMRYLQSALDRIRPVITIPTVGSAAGLQKRQLWSAANASSSFTEVIRYVTGTSAVPWPSRDSTHWIESGVEHEGPKGRDMDRQHYRGFHNIGKITATHADDSLTSEHIGAFYQHQVILYPPLAGFSDNHVCKATDALADYAEPLTVTNVVEADTNVSMVNDIYPSDYQSLSGVPTIITQPHFWASQERTADAEILEIDFGRVQPVNYIYFEMMRKPIGIAVSYDLLDGDPSRSWQPVTLSTNRPSNTSLTFDPQASNPWFTVELNFTNSLGQIPFTRFIQLTFTRRNDPGSPFIASDGTLLPWSIEARNLRVGRNIS